MSTNLFFGGKLLDFFTKSLFQKVNSCITQDEISKNRFKKLGVKNVEYRVTLNFLVTN